MHVHSNLTIVLMSYLRCATTKRWTDANGENPKIIQELLRHANLMVTMDTYVQAVTDEKRAAQNQVVKVLLPGIRRAVN